MKRKQSSTPVVDFRMIWKYDTNGNERPLEEQLLRRKGDQNVIDMQIAFYRNNPICKDPIQRAIAVNKREEHRAKVFKDIKTIERKIKKDAEFKIVTNK